ncbi:MAG: SoxR reducing system RseC family protein [Gammaproteobacteria bacterium]|nr:SoxR reducing system RseC family protein [Gammaproteobacteria bacterium]MBU1777395.1 SoxR reducing system RseC family protein [Gammaproteobacteria bacterium]MBU1967899.1 SoxR reducing system RseC family protein [Gammaproteobacteria bacterium]
MLEMRAIVTETVSDEATVQVLGSGCGHCNSEGGCGSGTLSKLFCSTKPRRFVVRNQVGAKVGDEVQVSLPDGILLRGALKLYVLPLVLLLAGGIAGAALASEGVSRDMYAVTGAVAGLLSGFAIAKLSSSGAGRAVATSILASNSGH